MPFGIKSVQEVFHKRMNHLLGDLPGVKTDIDDILLRGSSQKEHDKRLEAVLNKCEQINLSLNKGKCQFRVYQKFHILVTFLISKVSNSTLKKLEQFRTCSQRLTKKGGETTRHYQLLGKIHTEHVDNNTSHM